MREGTGGEGENERNEAAVAGGLIRGQPGRALLLDDRGSSILEGENTKGNLTVENEQVKISFNTETIDPITNLQATSVVHSDTAAMSITRK